MPGLGVATFPAVAETRRDRWVLISWDGELTLLVEAEAHIGQDDRSRVVDEVVTHLYIASFSS
jgi:hypothetical protein